MSPTQNPNALTGPERLHGLDALRGIALLLGLVVHSSMAFLPGAQYFWIAHDPAPSQALGLAFYVPHMFRMLLFFMLAGFFGRLALNRLGTHAFLKDRGKRITTVLLAGWPLAIISITAVAIAGAMLNNAGSLPAQAPPGPKFTPDDFPLTHLWFLYVLTMCYAGMTVLRALLRWIDPRDLLTRASDVLVNGLCTPLGPALLAIPLAMALYFTANWFHWFGIPTPDLSLYPKLAAMVAFGSAFVFGWWLHRQPQSMQRWAQHWPLHLAIAVATTVGCLSMVGLSSPAAPAAQDGETLTYALLYAWGGWSWTFALTGLALRFMSGHSSARRYVADASYWIYLTHLPVVMALQVIACRLPGPAPVKFLIVLLATFGLLLFAYRLFVRSTWIGAWLNGKRMH